MKQLHAKVELPILPEPGKRDLALHRVDDAAGALPVHDPHLDPVLHANLGREMCIRDSVNSLS